MESTMLDSLTISPARELTLADVIESISRLEGLAESRRRDLRSAVSSVARLLGLSTDDIVVNVPDLRRGIASLHHVPARITRKRLTNIKSDFKSALELVRALPPCHPDVPLSEAWKTFLSLGQKSHQAGFLARLSRYCAATGLEPEEVDDNVMEAFQAYLDARLITSDPANICRQSRYKFNAILRDNGLPIPPLTTRQERHRNLPLDVYPVGFREDLDGLVAKREAEDDWDEEGYGQPQSPITIRNLKARIRQALDAAISAGRSQDDFQSLADLANLETVRVAIAQRRQTRGGELRPSDYEIAYTLYGIAKHHVKADTAELQSFKKMITALGKTVGALSREMGERPRRQLDQFLYSSESVDRLLLMPQGIMSGIKDQPISRNIALEAMRAAALAILLAYPIRIKNLTQLRIGKSIRANEVKGVLRYQILVEAKDVKNGVKLEALLSSRTSRIVELYITKFRKQVAPNPTTVLFPTSSGGMRNPGDFGTSLTKTVRDATGLYLTPHVFRHFAGFLYLQANPGNYVTVQKLLGHKKIDTTIKFYAPLTSAAAVEQYSDLLDMRWGTAR